MASDTNDITEESDEMLTKTLKMRPSRCKTAELKKVGVVLIDGYEIRLGCDECGRQWCPDLRNEGRLPRGYWRCPEGCNAQS